MLSFHCVNSAADTSDKENPKRTGPPCAGRMVSASILLTRRQDCSAWSTRRRKLLHHHGFVTWGSTRALLSAVSRVRVETRQSFRVRNASFLEAASRAGKAISVIKAWENSSRDSTWPSKEHNRRAPSLRP